MVMSVDYFETIGAGHAAVTNDPQISGLYFTQVGHKPAAALLHAFSPPGHQNTASPMADGKGYGKLLVDSKLWLMFPCLKGVMWPNQIYQWQVRD